jgi:colanic acid/amylovoran biosynthesis glycosyltransferase
MKIAYLINQYPKTSHSFIRREILTLEKLGLQIDRFSIRHCYEELVDEGDIAEAEKTRVILGGGVKTLIVGLLNVSLSKPIAFIKALKLTLSIGWGSERGILKHFAYLAEACVLLGWFQKAKIDRVHAHFGTNSTTVAMLCEILGGPPYSFTVHGPEEFDKVAAIALPEKIKRAAFVIAISNFGRSQLYRWCDREHWSKIHVIRCGVDDAFLQLPDAPISTEPRLVCVGRLCEQKGQLLLVEAASKLASAGLQFKLVLVGDGSLRPQIEDAIARLKLKEYIEITGWASNTKVREEMLAAKALVLPSFAEGLPVVIMEALALSRPVISTYVAGIPELIEPGVCGWLVPASAIEELTQAMRQALEMSLDTLEQMGKAGKQKVAEQHESFTEAHRLAKLF